MSTTTETAPYTKNPLEKAGLIFKYVFSRSDAAKELVIQHVDSQTLYSVKLCMVALLKLKIGFVCCWVF
jgi:hypothetical protein